jgi:hypothetical protein
MRIADDSAFAVLFLSGTVFLENIFLSSLEILDIKPLGVTV